MTRPDHARLPADHLPGASPAVPAATGRAAATREKLRLSREKLRAHRENMRLKRQFERLHRDFPRLGGPLHRLSKPGWAMVRIPVGIMFVVGGLLSILPVFGLWMLPVGLLLLAVDVPSMRRPVSAAMIRLRRRADVYRQRRKSKRK
ncbi:hypothetical protein [Loktanella fryxellensis]|uniref:hypothetical protein n=1 Tax=Loktanella fryxellensis TaxID=245187 RepID=UPI00115FF4B8|nr:hypothetical protein [Loktanella fryxellensis]